MCFEKIDKLGDLWDRGKAEASLIKYQPGGSEVRQNYLFIIFSKKCKEKWLIKFSWLIH